MRPGSASSGSNFGYGVAARHPVTHPDKILIIILRPSLVSTTTTLARQSALQSVHQSAIQRFRGTLGGRKIGASDLYLQNVNSLRHTLNDGAFDIRRIRNPADCRMIDSNPGAGIDGGEATHNNTALGEGIRFRLGQLVVFAAG